MEEVSSSAMFVATYEATLCHNKIENQILMQEIHTSGVPRNFVRGGVSTNSVEDRGQRERESGGGSPLVRDSGEAAVIWHK